MIPHRLREHLTAYGRMAKEPVRYWRRWYGYLDNGYSLPIRQGYLLGHMGDFEYAEEAVALLQPYADYKSASIDIAGILNTYTRKPFYFNILDKDFLAKHPSLIIRSSAPHQSHNLTLFLTRA